MRRAVVALFTIVSSLALTLPARAFQPPAGQSEFVPVKDLPPTESIPAAPLLIGAYAFIWVAAIFYLWSIWRRLNKMEADLNALARKTPQR